MDNTQQSSQARSLTPEELATLVRSLREARLWSQEQLAQISGLSSRTVQRIEDAQPSTLDTRRALARAFEADDIDVFNKPHAMPTKGEMAAEKAKFEREHVTLPVMSVTSGKQLGRLAEQASAQLFLEAVNLPAGAEELFAQLADYCREYADCAELYSSVGKLEVYQQLNGLLDGLTESGFTAVAALRVAKVRWGKTENSSEFTVLYVALVPSGNEPETIVVERALRFR